MHNYVKLLLQFTALTLLQTTTEGYYKLRHFYYKLRQKVITNYIENLLQIISKFITNYIENLLQIISKIYYKLYQNLLQIISKFITNYIKIYCKLYRNLLQITAAQIPSNSWSLLQTALVSLKITKVYKLRQKLLQ